MIISISQNASELGIRAGSTAADRVRETINTKGEVRIVLATGASQFETLDYLVSQNIDWSRVEIFHLDEYIGLPVTHRASFRKYLNERVISKIRCRAFYEINTERNIPELIKYLTNKIREKPVDLGLIGIGRNGHIGFNDPPANFETKEAYIVVNLDSKCKKQQVGEGWFDSVDEVPLSAVTMTVWQIMQCKTIISAVPHETKAEAVFNTLTRHLTPEVPATMLKQHPDF
ncbi:MAG: 6-phosphogluconolactonase, partial [Bacteroidales bacterium]